MLLKEKFQERHCVALIVALCEFPHALEGILAPGYNTKNKCRDTNSQNGGQRTESSTGNFGDIDSHSFQRIRKGIFLGYEHVTRFENVTIEFFTINTVNADP